MLDHNEIPSNGDMKINESKFVRWSALALNMVATTIPRCDCVVGERNSCWSRQPARAGIDSGGHGVITDI